ILHILHPWQQVNGSRISGISFRVVNTEYWIHQQSRLDDATEILMKPPRCRQVILIGIGGVHTHADFELPANISVHICPCRIALKSSVPECTLIIEESARNQVCYLITAARYS